MTPPSAASAASTLVPDNLPALKGGAERVRIPRLWTFTEKGERCLGAYTSAVLSAFYFGPDFPLKLRLWNGFMEFLRWPRLVARCAGNGYFALDQREHIQSALLQRGTFEPEVWEALSKYVRTGDVLWDVGGNIGAFAIEARNDSRLSEIHSFEANPEMVKLIELNLWLSERSLTVHQYALADKPGVLPFRVGSWKNRGTSSLFAEPGEVVSKCIVVPVLTVDDVIETGLARAPQLMKIDVEGAEFQVLSGAKKLFAAHPPRAVIFEAVDGMKRPKNREVFEFFAVHGYEVTALRPTENPVPGGRNFIALKKEL